MQDHTRKYVIKLLVEGVATSACAHIAALLTVASVTFAWRFTGHVVADAAFQIAAIFAGW